MLPFSAGRVWTVWVQAYKADFEARGITRSDIVFDAPGHIAASQQILLLRGELGGGKSIVSDSIEGDLIAWAERSARSYEARRFVPPPRGPPPAQGSGPPPPPRLGGTSPSLAQGSNSGIIDDAFPPQPRLSLAALAEHGRLWSFCPLGCEMALREAARP